MLGSALHSSILHLQHILSTSSQGERCCGFASVLVPPTKCRKASELEINALNQMRSAGNT